jgi:cytosine/adenosine deaminase-related metal-dependent hydrolase
MDYVSGEILTESGFKRGYFGFENRKIVETGSDVPPKKPLCNGFIVPTLINAHTHIGDSFIRKKNINLPRNIEELVAPPHGLKHRLLHEASSDEITTGMKESINEMTNIGISVFCDFRENGKIGINQLTNAMKHTKISSVILSRPEGLNYDADEVEQLLNNSQGIGISSISDWKYSELEKVTKHAKKRKKMFALHASERVREDIDCILDLHPDFLVHMMMATESDLIRVRESDIPVVICPRSNAFFGFKLDIKLMKHVGIDLMVGTDNAMLHLPNILDEITYLKTQSPELSTEELLRMITYTPRKALNLDDCILAPDSPADFVVLDKKSLRHLYISVNK